MKTEFKMFVDKNRKQIETAVKTAVVVGIIAVIVHKTKTKNMISFDNLNVVIAEALDHARENYPDVLTNKEMYLQINKL